MDLQLKDKVALITGPAKGMGRAVTLAFAREGAKLVLAGRDTAAIEPVAAEARALGVAAIVVPCDLTKSAQTEALAAHALEAFGRIDILVNVAGGSGPIGKTGWETTSEEFDEIVQLNMTGCFNTMHAVLPSMIERRAGRIVAVTAKVAARGLPAMASYIASKSALQRLVEAMAAEAAPHGVNINSVAPSVLDTLANRQAMPDANPAEWVSTAVAAQTIGFLASPGAAALHGQHLALD